MKIMKESATDKTIHINQRHNYLIKIQNYFYFTFSYSNSRYKSRQRAARVARCTPAIL